MRISNVSFGYGNKTILEEINIEFQEKHIYGIVGHNGAGKTTLLRLALGILSPQVGTVTNDKFTNIAYMPEKYGLYEELTVEQNLRINCSLMGMMKLDVENLISEELVKWHLAEKRKELTKNLSTGLKQRLNFLCARLKQPSLLLCDEPTLGVDARTQKLLSMELLKMKEEGKTIILTSHNINFIEEVCDTIVIINNSKIVFKDEMKNIKNFSELYLEYSKEDAYE